MSRRNREVVIIGHEPLPTWSDARRRDDRDIIVMTRDVVSSACSLST